MFSTEGGGGQDEAVVAQLHRDEPRLLLAEVDGGQQTVGEGRQDRRAGGRLQVDQHPPAGRHPGHVYLMSEISEEIVWLSTILSGQKTNILN